MTTYKTSSVLIIAASLIFAPATAQAQPADANANVPQADPVSATRLILLGTGGGPPIRAKRSEPATLLAVDGRVYLIDSGAGTLQRLQEAGFTAKDVDGIFITHHHLDHNAGLAEIIAYSAFAGRGTPVRIFGPPGTKQMVVASLALAVPSQRIFAAGGIGHSPDNIYVVDELTTNGRFFSEGGVSVDAVANNHFRLGKPDSESARTDRSFSYRFTTPHGTVVFTGDTGADDAITAFAKGAEILVSEVADVDAGTRFAIDTYKIPQPMWAGLRAHMEAEHLTPADVGKMAAGAGVGMVILNHFTPGSDNETSPLPYVAGIRKYYSGPIIVGQDLFEYDLVGPTR